MIRANTSRQTRFPALEVIGLVMIVAAIAILVAQLASFSNERLRMPPGLVMAGIPVGGMPRAEAQAYVEQLYGSPISVFYRDQELRLSPAQVGLRLNSEAMLSKADSLRTEGAFWSGFWDFVWARAEKTNEVELAADYSADLLQAWLDDVALRYDRPPLPAQPSLDTMSYQPGQPGFALDKAQSLKLIDAALRRPTNRRIDLIINEESAPTADLQTLKSLIVQYLASRQFQGVASVHLIDLKSGDELIFNADLRQGTPAFAACDIAYAGQSTMKLAIMVDYFRYLNGRPAPDSDDYGLLQKTMVESGDITANFMMQNIGNGDPYLGAQHVTQMMRELGMRNSFIIAPYDDKRDPGALYADTPADLFTTPAFTAAKNETCVNSRPDYAMQTTMSDLGIITQMIYQCAQYGGGGLIAAYPNEISQDECKMMIDFMEANPDGIIMAGLPDDVPIAHKHGWGAPDTHNDVAIVYSPGRDYVLSTIFWADTYLDPQESFPLIQEVSSIVFNFYNPSLVNVQRRGFNPALRIGAAP